MIIIVIVFGVIAMILILLLLPLIIIIMIMLTVVIPEACEARGDWSLALALLAEMRRGDVYHRCH